jgi:hypothetical protein
VRILRSENKSINSKNQTPIEEILLFWTLIYKGGKSMNTQVLSDKVLLDRYLLGERGAI